MTFNKIEVTSNEFVDKTVPMDHLETFYVSTETSGPNHIVITAYEDGTDAGVALDRATAFELLMELGRFIAASNPESP